MSRKSTQKLFAFLTIFGLVIMNFNLGVIRLQAQTQQESKNLPQKFLFSDAVTNSIRRKNTEILRVEVGDAADRKKIAALGKIVEDYGSFVVLAKNRRTNLAGIEAQKIETNINLPGGKFEPLGNAAAATVVPGSTMRGGKDYYIVQFGAIATDEWLESVRETGAEIVQYVPHNAFFVYADGTAISKIANHSRVRWVGHYLPEQKISPALRDFTAEARKTGQTAKFDVAVFSRADLTEVRNELAASISGNVLETVKLPNNFFNVIQVELPLDEVETVARLKDVVRIDPSIEPAKEDERSSQIIAGNYTNATTILPPQYDPLTQFGTDGTSVTVSVVDGGVQIPGFNNLYLTTANAVDAPLRGAATGTNDTHGHLVASIISGFAPTGSPLDPTSYRYGLGVAPRSNIINIPSIGRSDYTGTTADTVNDTVTTPGANGVRGSISNNSWGAGNGNAYDSFAAQFDGFVQDASVAATIDPLMIVFSAGNSGAMGITRPKASKNTIAVGNSENLRTELNADADNMDDLDESSSRGGTADGRFKPDIIAPGTAITGGRPNTCTGSGCFDADHYQNIGTSFAAPQISGVAALFTQFWKNSNGGQNPSPALIKAAIINTGQEMSGNFTNTSTIPNNNEGWGRVNMKAGMFDPATSVRRIDQSIALSDSGQNRAFSGTIVDSAKPVRITLVWTDPPAAADPALVNNLDLTVTIGAITYRGNVFSGGNSTTGGTADTRNNVENVFLPVGIPAGTAITVRVTATAINGDGILGNADLTDQHFALVANNADVAPTAASTAVSGRVLTADGRSVSGASVSVLNQNGNALTTRTSAFGHYRFDNLSVGQTYIFSVRHKGHQFSQRPVLLFEELTEFDFVDGN